MFPMSTSPSTRRRAQGFPAARKAGRKAAAYHHGDLRAALIRAALELVEEAGPDGFTLREAARKVGVTHTAPYRHFADKDALLVAVAEEGFDGMHVRMRQRIEGVTQARDRLQQIGIAYVEYAVAHPSHFRVMHSLKADESPDADFQACKSRTFVLLLETIGACQAEGSLPPGPPGRYALTAWAAVHGLADLLMSGAAQHMGIADGDPADLARALTDDLMRGFEAPQSTPNAKR
jgi:AcrR family transcriptional regulator